MKEILFILVFISLVPIRGYGAFEFPPDVFRLLAETTVEPCSICVKQKLDKAFQNLNKVFPPGKVMEFDDACRLMKTGNSLGLKPACHPGANVKSLKEGEIPPEIVFEFYTDEKQLVGIAGNDLTDEKTAGQYRKAEAGTVFEGRIKLVPYKYGDGPSYNYFPKTNRLIFHCLVLELRPVKP
jgi:hypothetical protein